MFLADGSKAVRRDVTVIGPRSGGFAVDGIKEGDEVVTTAPATMKDGDSIKLKAQK